MQKQYDYEKLNELCNKISLLEYAEKTCEFQRRGTKYFCSCPKHSDSDPSLCISPDVNLFYCFSCHRNGNLINWMMEFEGLSFNEAVNKIADLTHSDIQDFKDCKSLSFFKTYNRLSMPKKKNMVERTILDIDSDYNQKYSDEIPQEWVDEGISPQELKKYEIRVDDVSNRIVYPVRDDQFNVIGVKGRTRFKDYKELKIIKYSNYYKIGALDYFTGMMQAADYVDSSKEIIIVEGIKSVMKLDQWGYHNVVSAETSTLSEYQIELLIRMQLHDVTIAFDKDVPMSKIAECTKLLKKFTNVYVVYDRCGLLDEKDSPCDKGVEIWKTLYERRVRI